MKHKKAKQIFNLIDIFISFDRRVNFLKYKQPEKDLSHLDKSEVFKIIHHLEDEPKHGISARPEKVVAADDIRQIYIK